MIIDEPNDAVLEEVLFRSLNMASPLQTRKWLSVLETTDETGILIGRNLDLQSDVLGFRFTSNRHGLRGPCDTNASTVVFGTSYAMGFSVDDGDNWYDDGLFRRGALNLGLPVGLREFEILLNRLHTGPCETAVFFYHPNIWSHHFSYASWRQSGQSTFEHFRWDMTLTGALERTGRMIEVMRGKAAGRPIVAEIDGVYHLLNPCYSRFDIDRHRAIYDAGSATILGVLRRFRRVLVFRIPTKEELSVRHLEYAPLVALRINHLDGWRYFETKVVSRLANCVVHDGAGYSLTDYLPCDTHWSREGNSKMKELLWQNDL